jgi:hypothetical protein
VGKNTPTLYQNTIEIQEARVKKYPVLENSEKRRLLLGGCCCSTQKPICRSHLAWLPFAANGGPQAAKIKFIGKALAHQQ